MSALDLGARALAMRANAIAPRSFAELCRTKVPEDIYRIASHGCLEPGVGGGAYVADVIASPALQEEHPAAVFQSGERFFRLVPDENGFVTPEQFGCPQYAPGVNAQPHIQAAIRYAERFGYGVQFTQSRYELWTPERVPDLSADPSRPESPGEGLNLTGYPLVIHRRLMLRSAPGGTTLQRRSPGGGDPADFTTVQRTNDAYGYGYWRGGLFCLVGKVRKPDNPDDLASAVFVGDWTLDGGLTRSATPGLNTANGKYRLAGDGTGWDILDKPIWLGCGLWGEQYAGKMAEVQGVLRIRGFAGEAFFGGGKHQGVVVKGRLEVSDSDAGQLDFSIGRDAVLDIDYVSVENCYMGMERCSGWNVRFGKIVIDNCTIAGWCGAADYDGSGNDGDVTPSFVIENLETRYSGGYFGLGNWVQVNNWLAIDCQANIGSSSFNAYHARVGTLRAILDRTSRTAALSFGATTSTAGDRKTWDNRVGKLIIERTPAAAANGKTFGYSVGWGGSLGDGNIVDEVVGGDNLRLPQPYGAVPDFNVGIVKLNLRYWSSDVWNCENTPALANRAMFVLVANTTTGFNQTVTLPPVATYPRGARITLRNMAGSSVAITVAVANSRMMQRASIPYANALEFENDGVAWVPLGVSRPLVASSGSLSLRKAGIAIPAGDVSDEVAITVNGVKAGMAVRVMASTTDGSGMANLLGRVTGDNTVAVRAQNMDLSNALTLGATIYRIQADWPA